MGFFDRLFGNRDRSEPRRSIGRAPRQQRAMSDEEAIQRYRYMVRTAPPETIEQAHQEAFARLTPAQRAQVLRELLNVTPTGERAAWRGAGDDPRALARLATRAETRQPGTMERLLGGPGMGMGMGGMMAGTLFGSLVAGFVGSMIANEFFEHTLDAGGENGGVDEGAGQEQFMDASEADYLSDANSGFDETGDDLGGDFGGEF